MTTRSHLAYAATQRETSVSSAKPVELVAMVYQRLLDHLQTGKVQMSEGLDSSESFTKAIDLITTGLESCLDKEKAARLRKTWPSFTTGLAKKLSLHAYAVIQK